MVSVSKHYSVICREPALGVSHGLSSKEASSYPLDSARGFSGLQDDRIEDAPVRLLVSCDGLPRIRPNSNCNI